MEGDKIIIKLIRIQKRYTTVHSLKKNKIK